MSTLPFSVVVVASSYGGPLALGELLGSLDSECPVPVIIVQHLPREGALSRLPEVLQRRTSLTVEWARQGWRPEAGHVYLAPQNQHLQFGGTGRFDLIRTEARNYARPAADVLFESAAHCYKSAVLGVVLTGRGRDGALGAKAVRASGGVVIVEDPNECRAADMPLSVLALCGADFVLPLKTIPSAITTLLTVQGSLSLFGLPITH